jgi:multicomponent Na+:H+ antiporter subunit D
VTATAAVLLAPGLPLAAALVTPLLGRWANLRETVTLLLGLATFVTVATLCPGVMAGGRPAVTLLEVFPGVPLALEVEPLGLLFALVASGLWIVTTVYSIGYMRANQEGHQTRYYACFAVAILGALGVAFSANLFTLFLFYELLTLSTYPLVAHQGTERAMRGARTYLGILLTTSIGMLLLAVLWTWNVAGTLDFRPGGILAGHADNRTLLVLLILFAFGTGKAALMPFHRWLPAAMVAPTPVSALLHAVAVVKAGVFTILKISVYVFGVDLLRTSGISVWLMAVAGFTVIAASLVALTRDNLKARLAYSTISQLSYIVLGASLANAWGIIGGGMHIVMHAFGKITLFFCAGAYYTAAHKTEVSELRGIGRTMPFTTAAFLVGALSVIGLPPTGGAWSKWYLVLGTVQADQLVFLVVLLVSSLLNIAYLMPIPIRGFFAAAGNGGVEEAPGSSGLREAPLLVVVPLCVTAAGCIALFFLAGDAYRLLAPVAGP